MSTDARFSRGTTRVMSWPNAEHYSCPLQSLVVFYLSYPLISNWRRTVSSKFFDTQVLSINFCSLVALVVSSFIFAATNTTYCKALISRIGRIENSYGVCGHPSQDTSHLILHSLATDCLRRSIFGHSLSLYNLWPRTWGVSRLLERHALIARKGSGVNNSHFAVRSLQPKKYFSHTGSLSSTTAVSSDCKHHTS